MNGPSELKCSKCGEIKPIDQFSRAKNHVQGRQSWCKTCVRAYQARPENKARAKAYYRVYHQDPVNKERARAALRRHHGTPEGKKAQAARAKKYRQTQNGRKAWLAGHRKYQQSARGRGLAAEYQRRRRATQEGRIVYNLRSRLYAALRDQSSAKHASAVRDLGCTIPEFQSYIASQFQEGMSWSNWGVGPGKWNIDHIVPFMLVDLTNPAAQRGICHYTNLRPLRSEDNLARNSLDVLKAELIELGRMDGRTGEIIWPSFQAAGK